MTTTDTIDYDAIEPGVRELCRVLNDSGLVRTLWSCEGHRPSIFGQTRPAHPFVIFHATELVAKIIQASLYQARLDGRLRIDWTVGGNFPPGKHGSDVDADDWQWNITPWQEAMDSLSFILQRKFRHDLARMPEILGETLLKLQEAGQQCKSALIVKHPSRGDEYTHRDKKAEHPRVGSLSKRIFGVALGASSCRIRGDAGTTNAARLQNGTHDGVPYSVDRLPILAHRAQTRKVARLLTAISLGLFLSACGTSSDVELQKDGSGTDEPRPSPCVGAAGSPCSPIPYTAPGFVWGRG